MKLKESIIILEAALIKNIIYNYINFNIKLLFLNLYLN